MGARAEEYNVDEVIMREGDPYDTRMYIVLEGEVVLYRNYGKSDEYLIGICGKGKTFGEMNLFKKGSTLLTAVAYTKVKVVWFEKYNLETFITGYPSYAMQMLENISKSYLLLEKNLEWAINEINSLREKIEIPEGEPAPENLDENEIKNEIAKMGTDADEYHYIHDKPAEKK